MNNTAKPRWLSKLVKIEFSTRYRELLPPSFVERVKQWSKEFVAPFPLISCLAFSLILIANELIVYLIDTPLWTYNPSISNTAGFLAATIQYSAALLGIVIPVVLLVVEFIGRDASSVIDVYFDHIGIKRTTLAILFGLGLESLFLWCIQSELIRSPKILFYITLFMLLFGLSVLLESAFSIWRLRATISSDFLTRALLQRLRLEVTNSQRVEAQRRLTRAGHYQRCMAANLQPQAGHLVVGQGADLIALRSTRSGYIVDVDLPSIDNFAGKLIPSIRTSGQPTRALIAKLAGEFVSKGDVLAYISAEGQAARVREFQLLYEETLRLQTSPEIYGDSPRLLSELKRLMLAAIRTGDADKADEFFGVYFLIFRLGIALPAPEYVGTLIPVDNSWSVAVQAVWDMHDAVVAAANHETISRRLSYVIADVAGSIIQNSEAKSGISLLDILNLFVTMYEEAIKINKAPAAEYAFSRLSRPLVDDYWIPAMRRSLPSDLEVEHQVKVLFQLLNIASRLIKEMIVNADLVNIEKLLYQAQPNEMLGRYFLVGQLSHQRVKLLQELSQVAGDDRAKLEQRLKAIDRASKVERDYANKFDELIYVASSYIAEAFHRSDISVDQAKALMQHFSSHHPSFERSISLLVQLSRLGLWLWDDFHDFPNTKHALAVDPDSMYVRFYCLRGVQILQSGQQIVAIPVDLQGLLPKIEKMRNDILEDAKLWESFLDISTPDLPKQLDRWLEVNRQINALGVDQEERRVREADLNPKKVDVFVGAIKRLLAEDLSLRAYARQHGVELLHDDMLDDKFFGLNNWHRSVKEIFVEPTDENSRVEDLAHETGGRLIWAENKFIIDFWLRNCRSVPSRRSWNSLGAYLEKALSRLNETGYQASLILIPSDLLSYDLLQDVPAFSNPLDRKVAGLSDLKGFYQEIPIASSIQLDGERSLLVLDVAKAARFEYERTPTISVEKIPRHFAEQIKQRDPTITDEILELAVAIRVGCKARATCLDKSAVVKVKLKFPDSAYL